MAEKEMAQGATIRSGPISLACLIFVFANTPLFKWADPPPKPLSSRVPLGVFYHAAIYHQFLLTGKWSLPPDRFTCHCAVAIRRRLQRYAYRHIGSGFHGYSVLTPRCSASC